MKSSSPVASLRWLLRSLAALMLSHAATIVAPAQSAAGPEMVWIRTTNYVPRLLTNIIHISIPTNRFHDEYRTNWVRRDITNVVDVYRTNLVTSYVTNIVPLEEFRTNVQVAYSTNLKTLTFTNWETVLVMRTNHVIQPVTNMVEIEVPQATPTATLAAIEAPATARAQVLSAGSGVEASPGLRFELTHTAKSPKANQYPIRIVLRSSDNPDAILPVREWRVEKVGGGAFMIGSRPEFTGTLPAGNYQVTVSLREEDKPPRVVHGQIQVTADGSAQCSLALAGSGR